jgi:hypothetical protein
VEAFDGDAVEALNGEDTHPDSSSDSFSFLTEEPTMQET